MRLCSLLAALLILWIGSAEQARAHAVLVRAEPSDGAMQASAPTSFLLVFNEPVVPLAITLTTPDGTTRALSPQGTESATLTVAAPPSLRRGTHVIDWRVISADGHPVGGRIVFAVGERGPLPEVAPTGESRALSIAIWAARLAILSGLAFGVGGAVFGAWIASIGRAQGIRAALILGVIASLISIGLQGLDLLGATLGRLASMTVWQAGATSAYGLSAALGAIAMLTALVSLATRPARAMQGLSLTALAGVGLAFAASGHAAAELWPMRVAVGLHAMCMTFWAGAFLPLIMVLRRTSADSTRALHRFSLTIVPVVAVVAIAGVLLAAGQLDSWQSLLDTAYGRILSIKLLLVAGLLAIAAGNRYRLAPALARGEPTAARRLIRAVRGEVLLVVLILGVVAVWRFTPPPRALAAAAAEPARLHIHTEHAMADLAVAPGRAGPVRASVVIMTGDFGPLDAAGLTLELAPEDGAGAPIVRAAAPPRDGVWLVEGLSIPTPGRWIATVRIQTRTAEQIVLQAVLSIPR